MNNSDGTQNGSGSYPVWYDYYENEIDSKSPPVQETPDKEVVEKPSVAQLIDKKAEKKVARLNKTATALGVTSTVITGVRLLLWPLLIILSFLILPLFWAVGMMGGMFLFVMLALVYPILIIVMLVLLLIVIVTPIVDCLPIALGLMSLIISLFAKRAETKLYVSGYDKRKIKKSNSFTWGLVSLISSFVLEPLLIIPTLLLLSPIILLIIIGVVALLQVFGIALA